MTIDPNERKAAWIIGGIAALEGWWVAANLYVNSDRFWHFIGFGAGLGGDWMGWLLAVVVWAVYVSVSAFRLPSVRQNLFRPSWLKVLALLLAFSAGILEEVVFRKWLMDWIQQVGYGGFIQVVGSALAFGVAHGIWGLFGKSIGAAVGATVATGILGGALAVVYVASGRSLLPCIAAHFFINALIEPGLVLAATRGEMRRSR